MRKSAMLRIGLVGLLSILGTGCPGDMPDDGQQVQPDAAVGGGGGSGSGSGSGSGDTSSACPLAATLGNVGTQMAWKANRCNVPGTMGAQKWYRLSAAVPGSPGDYIQLDLWPNTGAYQGGAVTTGTKTIGAADAAFSTCGVCARAIGDKTGTSKEYLASAGSVNVTSITTTLSATLTNVSFVEVSGTARTAVAGGCAAALANIQISGAMVDVGGGGGGGGGAACPPTVGD